MLDSQHCAAENKQLLARDTVIYPYDIWEYKRLLARDTGIYPYEGVHAYTQGLLCM